MVTSILAPGLAETGILAVTITDATFLGWSWVVSTPTPILSSMLPMDRMVKGAPFLSPVPESPTTRP